MNYQKTLVEMIGAGAFNDLPRGEVSHIMVMHDDWCAMLAGTGPCDCDPDFVSIPDSEFQSA